MRTGTGAVVLAVAVLAAGPGAVSASTAKTWTVRPGGTITMLSGKTNLTDVPTGAMFPCASSRISGSVKAGSGLPGSGIGSLTTAVYSQCQGGPFLATVTAHGLPWRLNLTSYDRSTGVALGTISHVQINVAPSGLQCTAVVKGTSAAAPDGVVAVSSASQTGILKLLRAGGDLHWYHARGCAGIVRDGDTAALAASYAISPRQVITSP